MKRNSALCWKYQAYIRNHDYSNLPQHVLISLNINKSHDSIMEIFIFSHKQHLGIFFHTLESITYQQIFKKEIFYINVKYKILQIYRCVSMPIHVSSYMFTVHWCLFAAGTELKSRTKIRW